MVRHRGGTVLEEGLVILDLDHVAQIPMPHSLAICPLSNNVTPLNLSLLKAKSVCVCVCIPVFICDTM